MRIVLREHITRRIRISIAIVYVSAAFALFFNMPDITGVTPEEKIILQANLFGFNVMGWLFALLPPVCLMLENRMKNALPCRGFFITYGPCIIISIISLFFSGYIFMLITSPVDALQQPLFLYVLVWGVLLLICTIQRTGKLPRKK